MIQRFVCIDTETGGLDPDKHSLLDIGLVAVTVEDGKVTIGNSRSLHVKAQNNLYHVTSEALKINKINLITHAELSDRIYWKYALEMFWRENFHESAPSMNGFTPVPVIGHNVSFDVSFLKKELRDEYSKFFHYRTINTSGIGRFLSLAGVTDSDLSKSDELFKAFPMPRFTDEMRHTALGDALQTAYAFKGLIELMKTKGFNAASSD